MKNLNDNLSKIFDVEPMEIIEAPKTKTEIVSVDTKNSVQDDFEVARHNTKNTHGCFVVLLSKYYE